MRTNKALDAEPPIASFMKSMLIGGGPVNANVLHPEIRTWGNEIDIAIMLILNTGDGVVRIDPFPVLTNAFG